MCDSQEAASGLYHCLGCLQDDLQEYQVSEQLTAQQRRDRNMAHRKFLEQQIVQVRDAEDL